MKGHANFRAVQFDNRFGLTDQAVINEAEALFMTMAAIEGIPQGDYGIEHMKSIHKHILGDMYPWAGELRSTNLKVGDNYAESSAPPHLITMELGRVLTALQAEKPSEMTSIEFADRMAMFYTKLYAISPFADGNARATRFLLDRYADDNGMQFKWQSVSAEAFHTAIDQALNGDNKSIRGIFAHITEHQDLYALHSVVAIQSKMAEIISTAGLRTDMIPSQRISDRNDLAHLARYTKQVLASDLLQYSQGGKSTVRDWDQTSIKHEIDNALDRTSGVRMLNETMEMIAQKGVSVKSGPRL